MTTSCTTGDGGVAVAQVTEVGYSSGGEYRETHSVRSWRLYDGLLNSLGVTHLLAGVSLWAYTILWIIFDSSRSI